MATEDRDLLIHLPLVTTDTVNVNASDEENYEIRTLRETNLARLSILPMYPTADEPTMQHLLLSNVPIHMLTDEQYARLRNPIFRPMFKLEKDKEVSNGTHGSFLLDVYDRLYVKMKKRLKINIPTIDFNLIRLRRCINKVAIQRGHLQTMLTIDELPLALEFYLQIDVDMFCLKTCTFNGVQPRVYDNRLQEGVFCIDPAEPRYAIMPCNRPHCLCCNSPCPRRFVGPDQWCAIPFTIPHAHRFVNQYEAMLNCPANCDSRQCIYVLTCPCGQFDFVGLSKQTFAETMHQHREEGNRIVREFLIGEHNAELVNMGLKSAKKRANDQMWLYQHSPRCSEALQIFLDYHPQYWCFVPMKQIEVNASNARHGEGPTNALTQYVRTDEQANALVKNVPAPPIGFDFSVEQRQTQRLFFKLLIDRVVPRDDVNLYNADIIAILPDNASELFGQLIESLFITHAECKLNQSGHLVNENVDRNRETFPGSWCTNLTRRR